MQLESSAKCVENRDKHTRIYHKSSYSIDKQKLQLCFTRGQSIEYVSYALFDLFIKKKKIN